LRHKAGSKGKNAVYPDEGPAGLSFTTPPAGLSSTTPVVEVEVEGAQVTWIFISLFGRDSPVMMRASG
jgi:hypothetical protein